MTKYWVYLEGKPQGPFTISQLLDLPLLPTTKVWSAGMARWYPLAELTSLQNELDRARQERDEPISICFGDPDKPSKFVIPTCPPPPPLPPKEKRMPYYPGCGKIRPKTNPPTPAPTEKMPPAYLPWTIALTLLCCSPLSAMALVMSVLTLGAARKGNLHDARRYSEITEWLIMISIALGALPMVYFLASLS